MYRVTAQTETNLRVNASYIGETIEQKVNRIVNNKEPIKDGAPLIYTDREEGVPAETDIRTDRWEIAVEAMDKVSGTHIAQRDQRMGERSYDTMTTEQQKAFHEKHPLSKYSLLAKGKEGKAQSTDTTSSNSGNNNK